MRQNSVTKQLFWFSLTSYIGVAIGIVSVLFIYPENPEFLGIIRTIESYSQIVFPIVLIGASQALVHYYPTLSAENRNRLFLYSLYAVLINSVVVVAVLALMFSFFDFELKHLVWMALPLGISIAFNEVFKRQSLNLQKIALPTLFEKIIPKLALPLIFILIGSYAITTDQGIWFFIVAYVLMLLLTGIYTLRKDRTKWVADFKNVFKSISKKEYFRYSLFAFTGSLGSLLAFRIDTIMLGLFGYAMTDIGIYNIGVLVASTLIIPATGIFAINSPVISALVKSNKIEELGQKYTENAKLLFAIGAVLYGCLFLGVTDLFSLFSTKATLLQSVPVLLILGFGMVINMGTGFNSEIITFSKYYRFNVISILLIILLNIGLNLLFVLQFKMATIGVAYASLISISIFNLAKVYYIKAKFDILPFDKKYVQLVLVVFSVVGIVYLLPNLKFYFWNLILKAGLCVMLNLLLIYKLKLVYSINNYINYLKNRFF
ncbi:MAG TPA: polysaccharide biosynthesis C-terminal domain-containing protein [Flavobacterium sp.]|nr:polysaccharide biosynthesis C-terminal domain-containing protein [Flavobacterium sp.]